MDYFTRIIPELSKLFGENSPAQGYHWLKAVYLFGSTLTLSGADEYSDIDIALFIENCALNELDYESKLMSIANTVGVDLDLLKHVEFHGYDLSELEQPSRFVEKEILERGLLIYWKPQLQLNEVKNFITTITICPKCKRCFSDCSCVKEPYSHFTESLFIIDTRQFQLINDINFVIRELKQQARLGHRDHLELALVMWSTFYEYLLNNIKYRIVYAIDKSTEQDIQKLVHLYGKTHNEFFKKVSNIGWREVNKSALTLLSHSRGSEFANGFQNNFEKAIEYRNSYTHGRAAYINGVFVNPREVNSFCLKAITDERFLFAPTIDFVVSIYRLFNPPNNKSELESKLNFKFPNIKLM